MELEEGGPQVRRTARARKVNPRFVGDDIDESYMKLVGRITASDYSGNKDAESLKESTAVSSDISDCNMKAYASENINSISVANNQTVLNIISGNKSTTNCSDSSSSVNIALRTVSLKRTKTLKKSDISVNHDLKNASSKSSPSIIVQCRSSTESEISEDSVENDVERKRKLHSLENSDNKKLRKSLENDWLSDDDKLLQDTNDQRYISNEESISSPNTSIKLGSSSSNSSLKLFQKAFVSLPISSKLDQSQPKLILSSKSNINLPGKQLKILSLKPITPITLKDKVNQNIKSAMKLDNLENKVVLGKSGSVELKIVKKDHFSSNLPPTIDKGNVPKHVSENLQEGGKVAAVNWFSSDGEDDIPLNKLIKEGVTKKKKKALQKEIKSQKALMKKKNKLIKNKMKVGNDQDDLPLKVLIKKSKSLSKDISEKVKNTIRKTKKLKPGEPSIKKNITKPKIKDSQYQEAFKATLLNKKKFDSDLLDSVSENKGQPTLKVTKLKPEAQNKDMKPFVLKKKKQKDSVTSHPSFKFNDKLKSLNKIKSKKELKFSTLKGKDKISLLGSKKKMKETKTFNKLRFKFPKKPNKPSSLDSPLSNETTNIVISVSGIEGDYACLAIDKDHIPNHNDNSQAAKPKIKKRKISSEGSSAKKYTFNSGLVLEEDVPVDLESSEYFSKEETPNTKTNKGDMNSEKSKNVKIVKKADVESESRPADDSVLHSPKKLQKENNFKEEDKNSSSINSFQKAFQDKIKSNKTITKGNKDSKDNLLEGSFKHKYMDNKEYSVDTEQLREKERDKKKEGNVKLEIGSEKAKNNDLKKVKSSDDNKKNKSHKSDNKRDKIVLESSSTDEAEIGERYLKRESNELMDVSSLKKSSNVNIDKYSSKKSEKELNKSSQNSIKIEKENIKDSCTSKKQDQESKVDLPVKQDQESKVDLLVKGAEKDGNKADVICKTEMQIDSNAKKSESEISKEVSQTSATVSKVKKKENFEEALLNIPLPKLSKHRRDKEEKHKKHGKDKKIDSKEFKKDIYLLKHKEYDNGKDHFKVREGSKSLSKLDTFNIKLESHSKDVKREEKLHHKEERRHSSSSSSNSKADKRKYEYESKDNIKTDLDSSFSQDDRERKRKRDEKERRHSSHKKHKKDHSESRRRSHSSSGDKKKYRMDEGTKHGSKESREEKVSVKDEDNKDIIINKIIDGEEMHHDNIKQERDLSNSSFDENKMEHQNSSSKLPVVPKSELKAEVIIDEEYLVNINKGNLKEEKPLDDKLSLSVEIVKSTNVLQTQIKDETLADQNSSDKNERSLNILKEESCISKETKEKESIDSSIDEESKKIISHTASNTDSVSNAAVKETDEFDRRVISLVKDAEDPMLILEADIKGYRSSREMLESSDIGILDELRNLKEMGIVDGGKDIKINKAESELSCISENYVNNLPVKDDPGSSVELDKKHNVENVSDADDITMSVLPKFDQVPGNSDEKIESTGLKTVEHPDKSERVSSQVSLDDELKQAKEEIRILLSDTENSLEQNLEREYTVGEIKLKNDDKDLDIPKDCSSENSEGEKTMSSSLDCKNIITDAVSFQFQISSIPLPNELKSEAIVDAKEISPLVPTISSPDLAPDSPTETNQGFHELSSSAMEISSSDEENISPNISVSSTPLMCTESVTDKEDITPVMIMEAALDDLPKVEIIRELTPEEREENEKRNRDIVDDRMSSFEHLEENVYLAERVKNKRSKEVKRMVCDCTLTKEEIANDEMGCSDDCLNKLLMIECGSRCPLKDRCMNKKFQQKRYSNVEVFNAEEKGCGVRACEDIKQGMFIMEYIGEVFDTKEFKRRRKEYAKGSSAHFYFMALRPDRLIDATRKGSISRFINHSCSPNAETQKWTVNGDIRIGFFATTNIAAGEEINFDYRLERYGREPQKCYCGTAECRGWLGEPPDQKTKEEKEEDRKKEMKDRQRREARRFYLEDMDLEDEIEKLTARGLRNRQDTLNMSRLMVRCEDSESRLSLLKILESGEEASKKLFLDYHGLKLLWSWMVDISSSHKCMPLKLEILKTLKGLPITNKTQVTDSKIINIVERWSKLENKSEKKEAENDFLKETLPDKKLSDGSEDSDTETSETKDSDPSPSDTVSPDDSSQDSSEIVDPVPMNKDDGDSTDNGTNEEQFDDVEEVPKSPEMSVSELASDLLAVWNELKEAFKIPKKERIEMMKEHEREVDKEYEKYLDKKTDSSEDSRTQSFYDRWRYTSGDRDRQRDNRDRDRRRDKRWSSRRKDLEDDEKGLSKEERRERFAKQVAKEEEEARQRKLQEEMWNLHLERCTLLGHDPYFTPIFDPSGQYYWDPGAGIWQSYSGPSGNLPVPASYGMNHPDGTENVCPNIPVNQLFVPGAFYPLPHNPAGDVQQGVNDEKPPTSLDPASIPLPGEAPLPKGSPADSAMVIPLPGEGDNLDRDTINGIETPPMAPPGPITVQLPQKWKMARDIDRRIYFYHTKTRHTQWDLPAENLHAELMSRYGLTSDSESDLESDSDTSSSSDSEDFSSDEDENEEEEGEVDTVKKAEGELDEKMIRRPKGKKARSEKLVQERVISPILFEDREAARRERKEAKERAREEARKERWNLLKALKSGGGSGGVGGEGNAKGNTEGESAPAVDDLVTSPNDNDDDEHLEEQLLKFSRKQKSDGKSHFKAKVRRLKNKLYSKERAATAMADTSDLARKIKDNFRSRMATYIVSVLNPYRKLDCKEGRITSNDDFKYLARKLTHFVMVKELKQLPSVDGLDCSESVKHKTKEFVRKYMSKYGDTFKRDPNDTKEY